jgi:hypothetical protein
METPASVKMWMNVRQEIIAAHTFVSTLLEIMSVHVRKDMA